MSANMKLVELAIERLNHMWLFLHRHGLADAYTRWEKYQGYAPYDIEKLTNGINKSKENENGAL